MYLELIERLPDPGTGKVPLFFVHRAWHGVWCWDEYLLPYFRDRGYPSYAMSFRGHGSSEGKLAGARLKDYVEELTRVIKELPKEPVLVCLSMGEYVVQKYLAANPDHKAAVLLASVPHTGILWNFSKLTFKKVVGLFKGLPEAQAS